MSVSSYSAEKSQKGHCSGPEHPIVDDIVGECFRIAAQRRRFDAAEAAEALYDATESWTCAAKTIGAYLAATGYDRIKGNRVPSRTDLWKAAHGLASPSTEKALRAYRRLMPRRVRSVDRMRAADLVWYLRTRTEG